MLVFSVETLIGRTRKGCESFGLSIMKPCQKPSTTCLAEKSANHKSDCFPRVRKPTVSLSKHSNVRIQQRCQIPIVQLSSRSIGNQNGRCLERTHLLKVKILWNCDDRACTILSNMTLGTKQPYSSAPCWELGGEPLQMEEESVPVTRGARPPLLHRQIRTRLYAVR